MKQSEFEKVEKVQLADVIRVWDELAPTRFHDIESGKDRSYTEVLLPLLEDFLRTAEGSYVIDVGCGVGFGSKAAAKYFDHVDAIDPSPRSISLARDGNSAENINYEVASVEEFTGRTEGYDALVSSMVLMDCPDIRSFLVSCFKVVKPGGKMIFTLCHPFFWPRYWGFEKYKWFSYGSEAAIQSHFKTSSTGLSMSKTIYFHRSLSIYLAEFSKLGAQKTIVREISGLAVKSRVQSRYPRYLAIEVHK